MSSARDDAHSGPQASQQVTMITRMQAFGPQPIRNEKATPLAGSSHTAWDAQIYL